MRFSRLDLIKGTAASSAIVGAGGHSVYAQTAAPIKFNYLNSAGVSENLPIWLAKDEGFFAQEGIDATLVDTTAPIGTQVTIVVGGSADSMLAGLSTVYTARQKGLPVRFLRGISLSNRGASIKKGRENEIPVAHNASELPRTLRALKGKTIGVPSLGVSAHLEFQALLRGVSMDPEKDVTFISVNPGDASEAAIRAGTVDLVYSSINTSQQIEESGTGTTVFTTLDDGPAGLKSLTVVGAVASDGFLRAHPTFERRYERAMDKAIDFLRATRNVDEAIKVIVKYGVKPVGSSRVDLQACKLEYSIVSPK